MAAIIPPFRFTTVETRLYRGAYPTLPNFRFLRRLKLKTLVSVIPEPPTKDLVDFCAHEGIVHHTFHAEKYSSDSVTVPPSTVVAILHVLLSNENLPIYIHCLDGANVIGVVVMALRKLQNWTKLATLQEFCRFTRDHSVEKDESEYLSTFSAEITVPLQVPRWLWNGVRIQKHPTMIITHQTTPQLTKDVPVEGDMPSTLPTFATPVGTQNPDTTTSYIPDTEKSDPARPFDDRREDPVLSQEDLDLLYYHQDGADVSIPRSLSALDLAGV
ncbi:hypothetical protein DYB28_000738 [Aphanomyces astaci]|uniref:Tyrosine specific protein phosphatases domain-containing protein n=1 Tax=Aphanomyces astaci TaxID=112090 RepID=A0A9X8E128_APHAT|nr:hypothetical protein DYB28_000738 [Aphanomyces astaci]